MALIRYWAGVMRCITIPLAIAAMLIVTSCRGPSAKEKVLLIRNGQESISVVQEFVSAFPGATNHLAHFGGVGTELCWGSAAVLDGRYVVKMYFAVEVKGEQLLKSEEARFKIAEVKKVTKRDDGFGCELTGKEKWFGEAEWNAVYSGGMDFSAIGYVVTDGEPVEHIEELTAFALKNN